MIKITISPEKLEGEINEIKKLRSDFENTARALVEILKSLDAPYTGSGGYRNFAYEFEAIANKLVEMLALPISDMEEALNRN